MSSNPNDNLPTLTAGSLFSGVGGLDLAASLAGFAIRFQVEIDPFCRKVLAKHAPNYWNKATQFADIRECTGSELGYVDCLFGGFPCQGISVAGNGAGLEDSRSGLWWEFYRLIGEIRPRAIVLENVAAIAYAGRGGTEVIAALAGLGYSTQWGIVSAADAGAPHQRNRWFCVGYTDSPRLPESPDATRRQDACDGIGNIEIHQPDRLIACESWAIRQILRTKTGLAHPYRQRREQISGYRADTRKRTFRAGSMGNALSRRFQKENRWEIQAINVDNSGTAVGNTNSEYIKEQRFTEPMGTEFKAAGCTGEGIARTDGDAQSGMGRDANGVSARMDGARLMQHQFPSRPNQPQHENEPSRLCGKLPNRRNRIKALGNAVVPQAVYPIFAYLYQRLSEGQLQ